MQGVARRHAHVVRAKPSAVERHSALLAHHWRLAAEPERAVPYIERAANRALRGGAFRVLEPVFYGIGVTRAGHLVDSNARQYLISSQLDIPLTQQTPTCSF